jgi:hypothetical protein
MPAHISELVLGRDRRDGWAAVGVGGSAGGRFPSRNAALRNARLETGEKQGAVQLASSPLRQTLGGRPIGHQGEGLPAWWRLSPSTRGSRSHSGTWPIATGEDKRWLLIDIGIVAALTILCLAVGSIVS